MCGIVAAVAERSVSPILLAGLARLEYRGYDSAGMAVIDEQGHMGHARTVGKVAQLQAHLEQQPLTGTLGIAHTRWATHGRPEQRNAHPHRAGSVAVVHNGIIENFTVLRAQLEKEGCQFSSDTDTEVIAHLINQARLKGLDAPTAFNMAIDQLQGAFAIAAIMTDIPDQLFVTRQGSPLVIGVGIGEYFVASDVLALLPVTQSFIYLHEGDRALIKRNECQIVDCTGVVVERPVVRSEQSEQQVDRGTYRHFMLKEIHEQPTVIAETLEGRIAEGRVLVASFGARAHEILSRIKQVRIIACGTSYHAGLVARYWLEDILRLPCEVEVASEFHYRNPVVIPDTLVVALSQSGETADTLAALRMLKKRDPQQPILAICNAPESSMVRMADLVLMTRAGPEISVASTKAFSTQLVALALLLLAIGREQARLTDDEQERIVNGLTKVPGRIQEALLHGERVRELAKLLVEKEHALFLGRGAMYPIALEGALKLKEISYIHAEAYPAGELKHGPLALIDENMPVITIAPQDELLDKLKSNMAEVSARGGELFVFADERSQLHSHDFMHVLPVTSNVGRISAPIIFNIPLQLLAYHVAVMKGTDIDQPRNLAKSVTVE